MAAECVLWPPPSVSGVRAGSGPIAIGTFKYAMSDQSLRIRTAAIIPTSLGVNPSLTISAVSERCAERLVARGADFGLPQRPAAMQPSVPPEHVGERVNP